MNSRRAFVFPTALAISLVLDQVSKRVAVALFLGAPPISLLDDFVIFALVPNRGGFMSLGDGLPDPWRTWIFSGLVPLVLLAVCVWLVRDAGSTRRMLLGIGLVAGGGIGNWIDRLVQGAVVDFVSVGFGFLRTGYFNVADVLIFAGIGLLALELRRGAAARPAAAP